jgi:hypothetical protein
MDANRYGPLIEILKNEPMIIFSYMASWIFLQITVFRYVTKSNDFNMTILHNNDQLEEKLKLIKKQNQALKSQKEDLIKIQNEILFRNKNLEKTVDDHTEELTRRNHTLSNYAFVNSRLTMGPIRELKEIVNNNGNLEDPKVLEIINDLNRISFAIGEVLDKQETHKIRDLEKYILKKYERAG